MSRGSHPPAVRVKCAGCGVKRTVLGGAIPKGFQVAAVVGVVRRGGSAIQRVFRCSACRRRLEGGGGPGSE